MAKYDSDEKMIMINRGDSTTISFTAKNQDGTTHTFETGNYVIFRVTEARKESNVVLEKKILLESDLTTVLIPLTTEDTKIGDIINKPVDYWYEISEETPGGQAQTGIGYNEEGAKIFRLYPEARDLNE